MKNNNVIDLFCGCGGLSLGFEKAGFDVVYAIDFWQDAVNTYNKNHEKKVAHCEDVQNLDAAKLNAINSENEIIGIIGGPPCQGFSTVGTRDINDPRNKLYLEYCRIVETLKPKFFVLENVKGLLTLSGGAFKNDIINRFTELGYTVEYQVVNAADFGVPQNRERVFFVGIKGKKFVFPDKLSCPAITSKEAISDLPPLGDNDHMDKSEEYGSEPHNDYQRAMREGSTRILNHEVTRHSEQTKKIISLIPDGGKIRDLPSEYWSVRKYNKAFERMDSSKPSNTVDTGHRNYFHYEQNRIPTARENARLQSFPDVFEITGSKTSQYKQIGNAVPPLLAYQIARSLLEQLEEE